jgi:hypothetical protein
LMKNTSMLKWWYLKRRGQAMRMMKNSWFVLASPTSLSLLVFRCQSGRR